MPVSSNIFRATVALLAAFGTALPLSAQINPSSAQNPFFGSVPTGTATSETLKLSLDDAVAMGLKSNLGLKEAESGRLAISGQKNAAVQNFLPSLTLDGSFGFHQQNLAAMGFGPSTLKKFSAIMGGTLPSNFAFVTKDTLTQGQLQFGQVLFSGPVIAAFHGASAAERAAGFAVGSARGEVVQQVAQAYLRALAAESAIDNAQALVATGQEALRVAQAQHAAGTAANLEELRAQVQLEAQQQALIDARNSYEKALIQLKREIGLDAGQPLTLSDAVPYAELDSRPLAELRAAAYQSRQDYQSLINQVEVWRAVNQAYRSQRLPSLTFGGVYNVSAVNDAGTHGNFVAQGNLSLPIFREAGLRGQIDSSRAQLDATRDQLASLRAQIDQQLRSALLDTEASHKLVEVSRSQVELATEALADEQARVQSGVDDNLPLVSAQAMLAQAQDTLVSSQYQYNVAKLALARATGLLETTWRQTLGK